MSQLMLDTSAYSALARGQAEIVHAAREAAELHVNAVVVGELLAGFSRGKQRRANEEALRRFLTTPRVVFDPIDADTSERYAALWRDLRDAGSPIPSNDLWIAASAWQHGLKLLTLDIHFRQVKQILVAGPLGG